MRGKVEYIRQLGIFNPQDFLYPVTLIGCGGIGSPTALVLAKMGCTKLKLVDKDVVSRHNIPNQLFRIKDVEEPKVEACKNILSEFSVCEVSAVEMNFTRGAPQLRGVVISGVDTMKARQEIWAGVKYNPEVPLYIDARTGGEIMEVFTLQPFKIQDIEFYEKFLYSDEETAPLPCTARGIMYIGFVIAGLIASQLAKFLKQEVYYRRVNLDLKTMISVLQ